MLCRKCTCTRRHCRRWSIRYRAQHRTTSSCGRLRRLHTVTSARDCCGASRDRASAVRSAWSSVTRSARTCSTLTVYRVSTNHTPDSRHNCVYFDLELSPLFCQWNKLYFKIIIIISIIRKSNYAICTEVKLKLMIDIDCYDQNFVNLPLPQHTIRSNNSL